jgi:predicted kinase
MSEPRGNAVPETKSTLIVFGGLPGTGKTTLARAVAEEHAATYLRIDTIEQALRSSGVLVGDDVGPAGYLVAYALAEINLRMGRTVVADSVNPLAVTRDAWRQVAATTSSDIVEIEVVCSDIAEHRRRVETRSVDVPGLPLPGWQDVVERHYEPWDRPRIVVDTAGCTVAEALKALRMRIENMQFSA